MLKRLVTALRIKTCSTTVFCSEAFNITLLSVVVYNFNPSNVELEAGTYLISGPPDLQSWSQGNYSSNTGKPCMENKQTNKKAHIIRDRIDSSITPKAISPHIQTCNELWECLETSRKKGIYYFVCLQGSDYRHGLIWEFSFHLCVWVFGTRVSI